MLAFLLCGNIHAVDDSAHKAIVVLGTSRNGLITAGCFAQQKNNTVIVVEKNPKKLKQLLTTEISHYEAWLKKLIYSGIEHKNLIFVTSIFQACGYNPNVVFICLDVPSVSHGADKLDFIWDVAGELGKNLKNDCIVVNKSTAFIGITDALKNIIQQQIEKQQTKIALNFAYSADFMSSENDNSIVVPKHVIIGAESSAVLCELQVLYSTFIKKTKKIFTFTDIKSAELAKCSLGAFRATANGFMRQLTLLADVVGVDVQQVKLALFQDQETAILKEICGIDTVSDHDIRKDLKALVYTGAESKNIVNLIDKVANMQQQYTDIFTKKIMRYFGKEISKKHIGICGLALKPETDDFDKASSILMIKKLLSAGACISVYDPLAVGLYRKLNDRKIRYVQNIDKLLSDCDCLIILSKLQELFQCAPEKFLILKDRLIWDNCGCFDPVKMINAGLNYFVAGREVFMKKSFPALSTEVYKNKLPKATKLDDKKILKDLLLENNMAHVFEDSINDVAWIRSKNFSPHGNAAKYSFLYILFRILNDVNPRSIIEFGIGQSSKLTSQYVAYGENKNSYLTLVENDSMWVDIFKKQLVDCDRIKILRLDLEDIEIPRGTQIFQTTIYKDLNKNIGDQKFDCIIVDGPHGTPHFSRVELFDLIEKNLADKFIIVMDDYNRLGEQETIQKVLEKLDNLSIPYDTTTYRGVSTQLIIYSPCYSFLKSL